MTDPRRLVFAWHRRKTLPGLNIMTIVRLYFLSGSGSESGWISPMFWAVNNL